MTPLPHRSLQPLSLALLCLLALALASCTFSRASSHEGPLYFEVEFTNQPQGLDSDSPAPFSLEAVDYPIRVTAMNADRLPMDWSGTVTVHVSPGRLDSSETVVLQDGQAQTTLEIALAFDLLRIWVSDEGTDTEPGSYATGVAPAITLDRPTIAELQTTVSASDDSSVLAHNYVQIKAYSDPVDPRELIVTSVMNDGFYVTDRSDPEGSGNSLFVFTFSRPDHVVEGARLNSLAGTVAEYIGYTEMQHPSYEVESFGHSAGSPALLDPSIVCADQIMEGWEASVVKVENLISDFRAASECTNYTEYGQWPALLPGQCEGGDARITVVNVNTVPSFDFPECEDGEPPAQRELEYLIGILRHVAPADPPWIIDVRSCLDLPPDARPADCGQLLLHPPSGPRKAPQAHYRDIETCEGVPYRLHERP